MKTTIDLPDDLLRRAKSEAARRGWKLREMVAEGILRVLDHPEPIVPGTPATLHQTMENYCGIIESGLDDLSTNPEHLEGFGED